MEAFEQMDVWKRSCRLCVAIYRAFGSCREYGFKDQIGRAALSVPSNIAEGYERSSSKEFARFLKIAKGSCGELRSQLYYWRRDRVAGTLASDAVCERDQRNFENAARPDQKDHWSRRNKRGRNPLIIATFFFSLVSFL
jgi:four helix bundle protein